MVVKNKNLMVEFQKERAQKIELEKQNIELKKVINDLNTQISNSQNPNS